MNEYINEQPTRLNDKKLIARLFAYTKGNQKSFIISIFLMLIAVALDLVLPLLLGKAAGILERDVIDFN